MVVPDGRRGNRRSVPVASGVSIISGSRFVALFSEETECVAQDAEEEDEKADTVGKGAMVKVAQHEDNNLVNKMVQSRMLPKQGPGHSRGKVSRREGDDKATVDSAQPNREMADQDYGRSAEAILAQAVQSEATVVEMPRPREMVCRRQPSDSAMSAAVAAAFA